MGLEIIGTLLALYIALGVVIARRGDTYDVASDLLRFIPAVLLFVIYLPVGAIAFVFGAMVDVPRNMFIGLVVVGYVVPLVGFQFSVWLHFVKKRFWLARMALAPMAFVTLYLARFFL